MLVLTYRVCVALHILPGLPLICQVPGLPYNICSPWLILKNFGAMAFQLLACKASMSTVLGILCLLHMAKLISCLKPNLDIPNARFAHCSFRLARVALCGRNGYNGRLES
jgi:hypothetical protein